MKDFVITRRSRRIAERGMEITLNIESVFVEGAARWVPADVAVGQAAHSAGGDFYLAYSVPGTNNLKRSHPDSFVAAMPRAEVPCVVCARKDWIVQRFKVYLWREADGSSKFSELSHSNCGQEEFLTCGGRVCFCDR